jgi:hypothetical protein
MRSQTVDDQQRDIAERGCEREKQHLTGRLVLMRVHMPSLDERVSLTQPEQPKEHLTSSHCCCYITGDFMRLHRLLVLISAIFVSAFAGAQTFTVEQPNSNKKPTSKVVRPGEVTADTAAKTSATPAKAKPRFEESVPSPSSRPAVAKHARKPVAKKAVKAPTPPPAPPVQEIAKATPPPKPAPKRLDPVPSLTQLSNDELRQQIEKSLHANPNITGAEHVQVAVTDTEVHLSGSIPNGAEKVDTVRLAQSYSGNRQFKDDLQISGSKKVVASDAVGSNAGVPTTVGSASGAPKSQQP